MSIECPSCGNVLDGATEVHGSDASPPGEGDLSICVYCSALSVFTGIGLDKRKPTKDELRTALSDERVRLVLAAINVANA